MRVSTAQFYTQNGLQMSNKQANVNEQSTYISSGKRVITAKDDAVSFSTLTGYKDDLASLERYQRNITQAENRNSRQEVLFTGSTDILNELRDFLLQANNGVRTREDLDAFANQMKHGLQAMLDVANTQDETGTYIFAGHQIDNEPFSIQPDNSVIYNGDNGVRELQIAKNIIVPINQSGDAAFQKVKNATGDFSAKYNTNTSGVSIISADVVDRNQYNSAVNNPQDYKFTFTAPNNLTVTDSLSNVVYPSTPYVAGQIISFEGIEVQLNGNPLPGDDFDITPQSNISLFDTIKSAIDWLNTTSSPSNQEQHQVDFNTILNQFNNVLDHISSNRAESGINMQLIERQKNNHLDAELYLNESRSDIEDLDYAKAVSQFEQSKIALQAAQQTFNQIKDLNLFNYI